jgi:hypothetical protein
MSDERRAGIEAVTRLLVELHQRGVLTFSADADAIAAEILDRVRDARGDDEGKRDIMDVFRSDEAMRAFGVERSPQAEDHET